MKPLRKALLALAAAAIGITSSSAAPELTPHVEFITPSIARVRWVEPNTNPQLVDNATGCCSYTAKPVKVTVSKHGTTVSHTSDSLKVAITDGSTIVFSDPTTGQTLMIDRSRNARKAVREKIRYDESSAKMVETANGKVTVRDEIGRDTLGVVTQFHIDYDCPATTALYGLGQHMEDYMNLLGKTIRLTHHNLKIAIPVIVSTQGFGVLMDAGCSMRYTSTGTSFALDLDAAKCIDYYFMRGRNMQGVADAYRRLTGRVELLPRYAFGYVQSRERYSSSSQIIKTVEEYRRRHVPLDLIVQDWNYWPQGWGYLKMDRRFYPSPRALADSVHALGARIMVSIWPNPQGCPQQEDFAKRGFMLPESIYDAFNPDARSHYWSYVNDEFFSAGFDAWWCDSTEPLDADWNTPQPRNHDGTPYGAANHERRWQLNKELLADALGPERALLYSLRNSQGIYENQRATSNQKRVLTLTRSSYPGQQRYATIVWNGDTYASWESLRRQIPAGLNYMATGNPYWTTDVGSFFVKKGRQWFHTGEFPDGAATEPYREYYTRMFQWATFLPMLRSHGTDTYREIWNFGEPGTPYYDAILSMIHTRYRLLPYTYSLASRQTFGSYTMARPLAFDFPTDTTLLDIKDQYLFGDIMVCPVTRPLSEASSRPVYLPAGVNWIDYWTGATLQGGQWLNASLTIDKLPLYVKAGALIVGSEVVDHESLQRDKPLTLTIYPGADATFTLYEDEGDGYGYEQGQRSEITFTWADATRTLNIKPRRGSYPGMPQTRTIHVVDATAAATPLTTLTYKGKNISKKIPKH